MYALGGPYQKCVQVLHNSMTIMQNLAAKSNQTYRNDEILQVLANAQRKMNPESSDTNQGKKREMIKKR